MLAEKIYIKMRSSESVSCNIVSQRTYEIMSNEPWANVSLVTVNLTQGRLKSKLIQLRRALLKESIDHLGLDFIIQRVNCDQIWIDEFDQYIFSVQVQ